MLTPMLAAVLALFPSEQATQATPAAPGPSQAGVAGTADPTRPEVSVRGFSQLFVVPGRSSQLFVIPGSPPLDEKKAKVICGTTVIIVDSKIDPKFVISPKPGQAEPTIRRMPKPMCGDGQK